MTLGDHQPERPSQRVPVLVFVVLVIAFGCALAAARHVRPPAAALLPSVRYSIAPHSVAARPTPPSAAPRRPQPHHLYIPVLHVAAQVVPVSAVISGTGARRTISLTPPQPKAVGLYSAGAQLGSASGTVLIVGHINLDGVPGAFRRLSAVPVGADIWVTDARDRLTHWRAYANPVVDKHSAAWPVDVFRSTGTRRLVLASCTGALSYVDGYGYSYDDNQFIYATPVAA